MNKDNLPIINSVESKKEEMGSVVNIGDIAVASSDSLQKVSETIVDLIKNKHVKNYLNGPWTKKKILGSGIG
tara:strand:- start:407 stop:622 length:216 start_codon:yes stop_codon:yes gene_type:complete